MARKDKKDWGLVELLSVVGFVFELLRVVVNALRKRGGTIEHLRRLIKEPDLVNKVFDLIVTKPVVVFKPTLLSLVGSFTSAGASFTGKFVARDHFKVNLSDDAEVKISYMGENFKNWLMDKVEDIKEETDSLCFNLLQNSLDAPIIKDLGGESKVESTLWDIWQFLKAQRNGKPEGLLLTNGIANIFYIRDTQDVLRAVGVGWCGDGWNVHASSFVLPCEWHEGSRVFSGNS